MNTFNSHQIIKALGCLDELAVKTHQLSCKTETSKQIRTARPRLRIRLQPQQSPCIQISAFAYPMPITLNSMHSIL